MGGDPWRFYAFDNLHCGSGLHSDTLIGNCDGNAEATLLATVSGDARGIYKLIL